MKKQFTAKTRIISSSLLSILFLFFAGCQPAEKTTADWSISLKKDVTFLASDELEGRDTGSEGERKAAEFLAKRFEQLGLTPAGTNHFYQPYVVTPSMNPHELPKIGEGNDTLTVNTRNVMALIDNPGDEILVIGAHYDHLGLGGVNSLHRGDSAQIHNGADDNASGVATMLQLAELLKETKLNKDILFIAFSGEEKGLWGSNYFAKNPTIDLKKVSAMINLDMVGRLDEQKALAIHGVGTSPAWPELINKANTDSLSLVFRESGVGPSDHTSFYLQDLPVLHFFTGQHTDYHKPSDDADKLNYEGMVKIAELISRIVVDIDKQKNLTFTKTKDESSETPRFTVSLGVVPDYLFNGQGMRIDGISEGKPAQLAGLKRGDVVVQLGEQKVTDMMSYMKALSAFEKGNETTVIVTRDGTETSFPIKF